MSASPLGMPCKDKNCIHSECDYIRRKARKRCPFCKKAIGYERPIYIDSDTGKAVHAYCHHQAYGIYWR
jgi:hypothetical protein